MLKNATITFKFTLVFILAVLLVGLAYFFLLRNMYEAQLLSQAQTTADHVEAFGDWVSRHGRVWVKDDASSYLGTLEVVEAGSLGAGAGEPARAVFYSKNPALAQREFSEAVEESDSHVRFRMTSDNVMNPLNEPTPFESEAIAFVKQNEAEEYTRLAAAGYQYARAIRHKESCIACHGSPEDAPREVITKYGTENGFGFKTGDVAGVISVMIPTDPLSTMFGRLMRPLEIGLVVLAFLVAYLYVRIGVVKPLQQLTETTNKLSMGEEGHTLVQNVDQSSSNEIDQLRLSVNRLYNSMRIAMQRMRDKGEA